MLRTLLRIQLNPSETPLLLYSVPIVETNFKRLFDEMLKYFKKSDCVLIIQS